MQMYMEWADPETRSSLKKCQLNPWSKHVDEETLGVVHKWRRGHRRGSRILLQQFVGLTTKKMWQERGSKMVINSSFMDDSLPKIEFIFTEDKVDENDAGSKVDENGD